MVPSVAPGYPVLPIGARAAERETPPMEVIAPARRTERLPVLPTIGGTVIGTFMIVLGIVLTWAVLATPLLTMAIPKGHPGALDVAVAIGIWGFALVAPAAFVLYGATRLVRILGSARHHRPKASAILKTLADLPDGVVVASGLTLPDQRGISDLVVGPFGAAVLRQLPPREFTRINEGKWQLRTRRGWIQLEDPLDRAVRDAERVRRWLGHDDADFVVKVFAAVVGPDPVVARTPACAVLTPDQVVPWIAALAPQRSLTEGRRERILDMVRAAV
jgi:hypothetical protein